jgi:hypothetical protein
MNLSEAIRNDLAAAAVARVPVTAPMTLWREAMDRCSPEWRERIGAVLEDDARSPFSFPTGDLTLWAVREDWNALAQSLT